MSVGLGGERNCECRGGRGRETVSVRLGGGRNCEWGKGEGLSVEGGRGRERERGTVSGEGRVGRGR